jgi:hypothetical protein
MFTTSSPNIGNTYVGRSNSFASVFAACLYSFAAVICNLSAVINVFAAVVV